jgi:hypothetical protein
MARRTASAILADFADNTDQLITPAIVRAMISDLYDALAADGSTELPTGYAPTTDGQVATKKYADDTYVSKGSPWSPSTLEAGWSNTDPTVPISARTVDGTIQFRGSCSTSTPLTTGWNHFATLPAASRVTAIRDVPITILYVDELWPSLLRIAVSGDLSVYQDTRVSTSATAKVYLDGIVVSR